MKLSFIIWNTNTQNKICAILDSCTVCTYDGFSHSQQQKWKTSIAFEGFEIGKYWPYT